eukprot:gene12917-14907_t
MAALITVLLLIVVCLGFSEVQVNHRQQEVNKRKVSNSGHAGPTPAIHSAIATSQSSNVHHQQPHVLTPSPNHVKVHPVSSRHASHPRPHVPVTRTSHLEYPMTEEMHKFVDPPAYNVKSIANLDLIIVYNGLIYPKRLHWLEMMSEQLDEFNCNGMADRAKKIYISLSIDLTSEWGKDSEALINTTTVALAKILPKAEFDLTYENRFEYPGIHKTWYVAQRLSKKEATNTIIAYFHAKGMVNTHMSTEFHGVRTPFEVNLFHKTYDPWPEVFAKFNQHPELNKVGCYTDVTGVVWYNVFYARASYVQTLVRPPIMDNRFFYELWLRCIDGDRKHTDAATAAILAVPEKDVKLPKIVNSGCGDCW